MILEQHLMQHTLDRKSQQELGTALQRYCLALTRSGFDAEDLAQETWSKALGYSKFTQSPNPEALLKRIAKNTWIDAARRQGTLHRAIERSEALAQLTFVPGAGEDFTEMELAFQALSKHLTPLQRMVFVLRDVLDYPAAEAAELLAITEGAVKAALHRARHALVKVREEWADGEGPALPQAADYRAYLRALARAYEQGQIPLMLELLRQETAAEVTVAIGSGTVQALYSAAHTYTSALGSGTDTGLRMAA